MKQMRQEKVITVSSRFQQPATVERRMSLVYWSVSPFWPRFVSLYTYWLPRTHWCLTKTFTKLRWRHGDLPYKSKLSTSETLQVYPFKCTQQTQKSPIKLDKHLMSLRQWKTCPSQSNRELESSFHLWRQVMPIFQFMTFPEAVVH